MSVESAQTSKGIPEVVNDFRLKLNEISVAPGMGLGFLIEKRAFDGSNQIYSLATASTTNEDSIDKGFTVLLGCLGQSRINLEDMFDEMLDEAKNDIHFLDSYKVDMECITSCKNVVVGVIAEIDRGIETGRVWYLRNIDKKPSRFPKFSHFFQRP
jgi:hypothetical protein